MGGFTPLGVLPVPLLSTRRSTLPGTRRQAGVSCRCACAARTPGLAECVQQEGHLPLDARLVALLPHAVVSERAQGKPPGDLPGGAVVEDDAYGDGRAEGKVKWEVLVLLERGLRNPKKHQCCQDREGVPASANRAT